MVASVNMALWGGKGVRESVCRFFETHFHTFTRGEYSRVTYRLTLWYTILRLHKAFTGVTAASPVMSVS